MPSTLYGAIVKFQLCITKFTLNHTSNKLDLVVKYIRERRQVDILDIESLSLASQGNCQSADYKYLAPTLEILGVYVERVILHKLTQRSLRLVLVLCLVCQLVNYLDIPQLTISKPPTSVCLSITPNAIPL